MFDTVSMIKGSRGLVIESEILDKEEPICGSYVIGWILCKYDGSYWWVGLIRRCRFYWWMRNDCLHVVLMCCRYYADHHVSTM